MKNVLLLICLIILVGCGKFTHKITGVPKGVKIDIPSDFKIGPDFEKAAKFCDSRYGKGTVESEACFTDYRNYTKVKISVDVDALSQFCIKSYNDAQDQTNCLRDLLAILEHLP